MGSHCILRTSQHRARPFSSNPKIYFLLYDTVHNYIGRCSGHIDSSMQLYCQYTATITTANSAHCYFAMAYGSGHSKNLLSSFCERPFLDRMIFMDAKLARYLKSLVKNSNFDVLCSIIIDLFIFLNNGI